jgi:hypothetical protein
MSVAVRAGAGLAGLAFLAGCQLVLDFSPLTDGGVPDGGVPDAGADAADFCPDFEPNELLQEAQELDVPGPFRAAICPRSGTPDEDFYSITMDGNQDLNILLTFEAGDNDLELELYHQLSGMKLVVSTGTDGDEQIARTFAAGNRLTAGTYAIRVFGRSATVANEYELTWARGPLP